MFSLSQYVTTDSTSDSATDSTSDSTSDSATRITKPWQHALPLVKQNNTTPNKSIFVPPTVEEVASYCRERGRGVDARRFVDFYASKGWLVGKAKMRDWRAAVRNWESNSGGQAVPSAVPSAKDYDEEF